MLKNKQILEADNKVKIWEIVKNETHKMAGSTSSLFRLSDFLLHYS
jgi:hypothetical protein